MTASTPTDATGRCFVSYRRSRLAEIRWLIAALHDHGIPTWQDLTDLDEEPLEPALRAALAVPETASGVLWVTPEVADSPVVTGIEIPELIDRAERGDGFYLVPVAAGGLDYTTAARTALARTTLNDFGMWNLARVNHDPMTDEDATAIARRVLVRRVAAIHAARPAEVPLVIDVYTHGPAVHRPDAALTVDFTHRFDGRHAHAGAWAAHVLPALNAIVDETARRAPGRLLRFRGLVGLPAAVALGTTLLAPAPCLPPGCSTLPAAPTPRTPWLSHDGPAASTSPSAIITRTPRISPSSSTSVRTRSLLSVLRAASPSSAGGFTPTRPARTHTSSRGLARRSTSLTRSSWQSGPPVAATGGSATSTSS